MWPVAVEPGQRMGMEAAYSQSKRLAAAAAAAAAEERVSVATMESGFRTPEVEVE